MSMQEDVRSAVPRTVTPGSSRSSRPTNGHAGK